ncbi:conserved exported hypothetical protein [Thiomonas arsenitoxydans]|uniref:DUF3108 domain-containing protein n=2 Tax=Thiomonas arsenitoxydans (strain DSM 22701 / CIP 110005 / 3As) TaxID=426114 RepID=D6CPA4_THIA3|nr:DUF3108 domain-containing protein [Thiomonas arsenitoxydans]CAZ90382.1 conserved hypothetical protein [Thiomonas arsenitoxydans]CQR28283.1 conserved exported hypothetical protein [Thiomonas arsenitoxydans]CQR28285.1 conserved exported hypothetical protein [Thiomonas arsenitoxydans]CQR28600.1 conserved exported hypothetical protein [Thiomonas arsenitoxydans]CQR31044.1 conserved exported hypothetical protein [Thiomonas arsenitoxydans]
MTTDRRTRGRPGWRTIALLALGVVALHLAALDWLGTAFRPLAAGKLPEPIYTQLLKPTPPVVTAARPALASPPKPAKAKRPPALQPAPMPAPEPAADIARPRPAETVASSAQAPPAPVQALSAPPPPTSAPLLAAATSLGDLAPADQVSQPARPIPTESSPAPTASAPASAAAPRPWPPSTRLSYTITGYWRGHLHGSGALVWTVDGDHYEARLSGSALIGFSYRSTGRIEGDWLAPSEYTERVFTREKSVRVDRGDNTLHFSASPAVLPLPPHVQDSASLFLQLANRLSVAPGDFHPGATLSFAVARPSGMADWAFTIAGMDIVDTPIGSLPCWHIVRQATQANELGAQIWLSPQLQNLPVQIRLQHSADSYLLFTLDHAEQAGATAPASAKP